MFHLKTLIIIIITIIIIIISISKEDYVFSMTANLPYGPLMNKTLIIIRLFSFFQFFVRAAMLVVRYLLVEEKPVVVLKC